MKFFEIHRKEGKGKADPDEFFPSFVTSVNTDDSLLIKGGEVYGVFDERTGMWVTEDKQQFIVNLVDQAVAEEASKRGGVPTKKMKYYDTRCLDEFLNYVKKREDTKILLDQKIMFKGDDIKCSDYASKTLPYSLSDAEPVNYLKFVNTVLLPSELLKLEWCWGSIFTGDSKKIQKMPVLYGEGGTGKSTLLDIAQQLFEGYCAEFSSGALANASDQFSTSCFEKSALVYIDTEGDLSKIEQNTVLNQAVAHERITINQKGKKRYTVDQQGMLMVATNEPVKITSSTSGMIRRVLDITPTGKTLDYYDYMECMDNIQYELGAIANRCINIYNTYGPDAYNKYEPIQMKKATYHYQSFLEDQFDYVVMNDPIPAKTLYTRYKNWCEDNGQFVSSSVKFKNEMKQYYEELLDRVAVEGYEGRPRNVLSGFKAKKIDREETVFIPKPLVTRSKKWLKLESTESLLDKMLANFSAQYEKEAGGPEKSWDFCDSKLKDIDTTKTHYVRVPINHIVIDLDIKDAKGNKDKEANLKRAGRFPKTYAEFSKSGGGVHLHYIYDGDPEELVSEIEKDVEIKVYKGKMALRRRLSFCNNITVAHICSGLPLKKKEVKEEMIPENIVKDEDHLRNKINKYIRDNSAHHTVMTVNLIYEAIEGAYRNDVVYNIEDMRKKVRAFAAASDNPKALELCNLMHFKSDHKPLDIDVIDGTKPFVIFDIESASNHWCICYKYWNRENEYNPQDEVFSLVDPKPDAVRQLIEDTNLIGFNNLNYDNPMIHASAYKGFTTEELNKFSRDIISGEAQKDWKADMVAYADIFEIASKVQSLKKWEIELGLPHKEFDLGFDVPVPDDRIDDWVNYCKNDVLCTEAVLNHNINDWNSKMALSKVSGLPMGKRVIRHAAQIVFDGAKNPQKNFNYPDLSEEFPGYKFEYDPERKKYISTYLGDEVGEGGYVYAEPGYYKNVKVYDVASMHPSSIIAMNMFGEYTKRFADLKKLRILIKHRDFEAASKMMDGAFAEYLTDEQAASDLTQALKLVINKIYGFTSASWESEFVDPSRNKDNKVAKRGALFMRQLLVELQEMGVKAVHVKTDSIKIVEPTQAIENYILKRGRDYGYEFEVEDVFDEFVLVNGSTYVGKDPDGIWHTKAKQFQEPYVYKKLFALEDINDDDCTITCSVKSPYEIHKVYPDGRFEFVGRVGKFLPVHDDAGIGADLRRFNLDTQHDDGFVTGTKGYKFIEFTEWPAYKGQTEIDYSYWEKKVEEAVEKLAIYGFTPPGAEPIGEVPPWIAPCGEQRWCEDCDDFIENSDGSRWCKIKGVFI